MKQRYGKETQKRDLTPLVMPEDGIIYETNPNGGIINIGAYGGTSYASNSSTSGPDPNDLPIDDPVCVDPLEFDNNNDCKVNLLDLINLTSQWLDCGYADPEDCNL